MQNLYAKSAQKHFKHLHKIFSVFILSQQFTSSSQQQQEFPFIWITIQHFAYYKTTALLLPIRTIAQSSNASITTQIGLTDNAHMEHCLNGLSNYATCKKAKSRPAKQMHSHLNNTLQTSKHNQPTNHRNQLAHSAPHPHSSQYNL